MNTYLDGQKNSARSGKTLVDLMPTALRMGAGEIRILDHVALVHEPIGTCLLSTEIK